MTTPLNLSDMPRDWQLCFNADCPFRDRCLRFLAGSQLAATREWGAAIYPSALHDGRCNHFCPAVPVRSAVGFTRLFDAVKACHAAPMRRELKNYLGGNGTYYLYRNGQRPLNADQHAWIDQLFRRYGYDRTGPFDRFDEVFYYKSTGSDHAS